MMQVWLYAYGYLVVIYVDARIASLLCPPEVLGMVRVVGGGGGQSIVQILIQCISTPFGDVSVLREAVL